MKFIGGVKNLAENLKTKQLMSSCCSLLFKTVFVEAALYHNLSYSSCGMALCLKPTQIRRNPRMHVLVNYDAAGLR